MSECDHDKVFTRYCPDCGNPVPMKPDQYHKLSDEALAALPEEFRGPLNGYAYQEWHGSGYEEVLQGLEGLIDVLAEPIDKYTKRIRGTKK